MRINYGDTQSIFDIDKVKERIGATRYLGEFEIYEYPSMDISFPQSLFYSRSPDKSKGHKQFPYVFRLPSIMDRNPNAIIGAIDKKIFDKQYRYWTGVYCPVCNEVIVSVYRHHNNVCTCESEFIDGGRRYTRCKPGSIIVRVDIFKQEVLFGSNPSKKSQATKQMGESRKIGEPSSRRRVHRSPEAEA